MCGRLQVATHILAGLSAAVDACQRACSAPFGSASLGPPSRIATAKAAYSVLPRSVWRQWHCANGFGSVWPLGANEQGQAHALSWPVQQRWGECKAF